MITAVMIIIRVVINNSIHFHFRVTNPTEVGLRATNCNYGSSPTITGYRTAASNVANSK